MNREQLKAAVKLGMSIKGKSSYESILADFEKLEKTLPHIKNDKIVFVCPSCNSRKLECVEFGIYTSEVLNIDKDGDFDYGAVEGNGEIERWQCLNCGFVLLHEDGTEIFFTEDVVKWCLENCQQP
jgi:hypothetical protein